MIKIENLEYSYKTFEKKNGFINTVKDFFNRKYIYKKAVDVKSLEIKEGEIVALLGPNGAGKTTLIKLMIGILEKNNGEITINNFYPYEKKEEYLSNIGVVMGQKSQLFWDLPSIDTLKLLKDVYKISDDDFNKRLDNLLELLNLKEKLYVPVRKLSLGERLKFELICSLIHNPKILFLDEPTIGVDIVSQKNIYDFLLKVNKENNTTIILTSHYMKDVEAICNRIVVIIKGSIKIDSNLESIKNEYKTLNKYVIKTKKDEIPNISFKKIGENEFEFYSDDIIDIKNNSKGLDEIIYEIFRGN